MEILCLQKSKIKLPFKLFFLFALIGSCFWLYFEIEPTVYKEGTQTITGTILSYKINGDQLQVTIHGKEKIIGFYTFPSELEKNKFSFEIGDQVSLSGSLEKPMSPTNPYQFHYPNYLRTNHIYWTMKVESLKQLQKPKQLHYRLKSIILHYFESFDNCANLKLLLLGISDEELSEPLTNYRSLGISHLMAVSGMHLSILLELLFFFLPKKKRKTTYICMLCLGFYAFLVQFTPSVMRAFLQFVFKKGRERAHIKANAMEDFCIITSLFLLWNPYYLYHIGFQYSFFLSFLLMKLGPSLKGSYVQKLWTCSLYTFFGSAPITIFHFYSLNLLSPLVNMIYIPYVTLILFPLALLTLFLPIIEPLFGFGCFILEQSSRFITKIPTSFSFGTPSICFLIVYYGTYYFCWKQKKTILILGILFVIQYYQFYFFPKTEFIVFDVGQGDAMAIIHSNRVFLIDTGGKLPIKKEKWKQRNSKNTAETILIPYLKARGIHTISALFLTHGDYDHAGNAQYLVEHFPVKQVFLNQGNINSLEKSIQTLLLSKRIPWSTLKETVTIDHTTFFSLNTKEYPGENENSLVLYTKLKEKHILLMGDASIEVENDIKSVYSDLPVDILKVGHHGSNTSTSASFLEFIQPKYGIISVGRKNSYGHPSPEVLKNLKEKNVNVLMTSREGMVRFILHKNNYNIAFGAANALAFI